MSRILTTPTTPMAFLTGKLLAMMSLGVAQFLLFILWGRFVMGVDWGRDPVAVGVMVIVYVFAATGLGVLVGATCRTMAQAEVIASFVTYGTSMIAGSWWPIEVAPPYMQKMAQVLPQYWAINGLNKIVVRGLPLSSLSLNITVLAGMGLLFLCAGTLVFARRARS
jgi:ABC-2 type transport system permease protein